MSLPSLWPQTVKPGKSKEEEDSSHKQSSGLLVRYHLVLWYFVLKQVLWSALLFTQCSQREKEKYKIGTHKEDINQATMGRPSALLLLCGMVANLDSTHIRVMQL